MEQRIKIIAIALGVIFIIVLFFAFTYVNKYNALSRDHEELIKKHENLKKQNDELTKKAASTQEELGRLKDKTEKMKNEIGSLSSSRDDLQKKYDTLLQEREKLVERLKSSSGAPVIVAAPTAPAAAPAPPPADEYWAGILKQKENLELQLSSLKDAIKNNQFKVDELTQEKTSLDLEVQRLVKDKADLQRQLEYTEKVTDSLSLQLVRERDDKRKIVKQANLFKEENYVIRSRVKDLMSAKVSLEKKLKDAEDKRMELAGRLTQMDEVLEEKLSSILDTKQDISDIKKGVSPSSGSSLELPAIVVPGGGVSQPGAFPAGEGASASSTATADASQSRSSGRVISVNEENNFVIVDIGEDDGVYQGQTLSAYRGSEQIASLEVVEVRAHICAADIKEKAAYLKAGDIVR
ncbi:hypothetical protein EPN16_08095 [bacterium]|nr:MAG: hypothetical protein EPN16_08095 [bacterium]